MSVANQDPLSFGENEQLVALSRITKEMAQYHDAEKLIEDTPKILVRDLDFDRASVFMMEGETPVLKSFCFDKDTPELVNTFLENVKSKKMEPTVFIKRCIEEGKTVFIPDLNKEPDWPKADGEIIRTKGVLMVPIKSNEETLGMIAGNMQHHDREMDQRDISRMEIFANTVGFAVGNLRQQKKLEDRVKERTLSLEKANEALNSERNFVSEVLDTTNALIVVLSGQGKVIRVNSTAVEVYGVTEKEIIGQHFWDVFSIKEKKELLQEFFQQILTGELTSGYFSMQDIKNQIKEIAWSSSVVRINDKVEFVVATGIDITIRANALKKLKETQAQLVQTEKMASLGNLVAGIAHEINTPIGAVHSMHDTLVRLMARMRDSMRDKLECLAESDQDLKLTEFEKYWNMVDDANKVIKSGTNRVTEIVKRLRSFARLDEAEMQRVDIRQGLEDTLTLIHHEIKHRIKVERDFQEIPQINCYPGRLNQVFLNLLNNSRQAIEDKGTLEIKVWHEDGYVNVSIKDDGMGIKKENIQRIFDPGFTTKGVGVGTGLGLSICFQIIKDDHNGELEVKSEEGKWTEFTIRIPDDLSSSSRSEKN